MSILISQNSHSTMMHHRQLLALMCKGSSSTFCCVYIILLLEFLYLPVVSARPSDGTDNLVKPQTFSDDHSNDMINQETDYEQHENNKVIQDGELVVGNIPDTPKTGYLSAHGESMAPQMHPVKPNIAHIPDQIPINPDQLTKTIDANNALLPGDRFGNTVPEAPRYMVELYKNFSTDKYSHPVTNVVRSFMNINDVDVIGSNPNFGNKTRIHTLVFNITSIAPDEDIYLAELRLFTLVEADRNKFTGLDRRVSVYEIVYDELKEDNSTEMISVKDIYGKHSGWETFPVTEAVDRWVKSGLAWNTWKVLEVHIDSFVGSEENMGVHFDTKPHNDNEPLLVVFSNDYHRKKAETRELNELINHEMELYDLFEESDEMNEIDEDYYDYDFDDLPFELNYENYLEHLNIKKRDTSSVMQSEHEAENTSRIGRSGNSLKSKTTQGSKQRDLIRTKTLEHLHKRLRDVEMNMSDNDSQSTEKVDNVRRVKRSSKSRRRRRRGRRRFCRRRPLYINFADIGWHTWIIAPRGYQAFQCAGRCDFPLSDHLTPTKHAIIQTMVQANLAGVQRKHKAQPACCVPTKLAPISILYIDDKGTVTYKYDYDEMVVTECGCR